MERIDYCYHTHTYRCGHAFGSDEAYVLAAIAFGIKRLGFTDHVMIEGVSQPGIRGEYALKQDYIDSIKGLREKYKDQIEILIGFECEYSPKLVDYYKELLKEVDYLILGQHCALIDNKMHWYFNDDLYDGANRYLNDLIDGIKSGLFTYVAHPDLFACPFEHDDPIIEEISHKILKTCEQYRIPIELNIGSMRRKGYSDYEHFYPTGKFFELAKQYDVEIVAGIDAHFPDYFDDRSMELMNNFISKHNLKINRNYEVGKKKV